MFGKIFGTKNSINEQLKNIELYKVSEEDKIQMRLDIFNSYTAFKIAQRVLGTVVSLMYLLTIIISLIYHNKGLDFAGIVTIVDAFELGFVMLAIVGFYFSGGAIDSFKQKDRSFGK